MQTRLKRTSGKTWAKLESDDFITPRFLNEIGEILVDAIVYEAGKDFAKQGNTRTPIGEPEGIPRSVRFFDSFKYKTIPQKGRVEVFSDWPWILQIIEGRRPYPMEWLTQQEGVSKVPMKQEDGTVLIKTTPATKSEAWIHPGFQKHTFVRRGYEKARRKMAKKLEEAVMDTLIKTPFA